LGDWVGTGNGIGRQWSPEGAAQPEPRATPWECGALLGLWLERPFRAWGIGLGREMVLAGNVSPEGAA
jgi:hypothetical protein